MKYRKYQKIIGLLLLLGVFSLLLVCLLRLPEPPVRRLNWLFRPGAYAIYVNDETLELDQSSIRMMVLTGDLFHTTIQVSSWSGVDWENPTTLVDVPIYISTSFWAANDIRLGGLVYLLDSASTSSIFGFGYDEFDETETGEGHSGQFVIAFSSITSSGDRYSGRYVIGCGLATRLKWHQSSYHLFQTNILLISSPGFYYVGNFIMINLLIAALIVTIRFTLKGTPGQLKDYTTYTSGEDCTISVSE